MQEFKKKPVVIELMHLTLFNMEDIEEFVGGIYEYTKKLHN